MRWIGSHLKVGMAFNPKVVLPRARPEGGCPGAFVFKQRGHPLRRIAKQASQDRQVSAALIFTAAPSHAGSRRLVQIPLWLLSSLYKVVRSDTSDFRGHSWLQNNITSIRTLVGQDSVVRHRIL